MLIFTPKHVINVNIWSCTGSEIANVSYFVRSAVGRVFAVNAQSSNTVEHGLDLGQIVANEVRSPGQVVSVLRVDLDTDKTKGFPWKLPSEIVFSKGLQSLNFGTIRSHFSPTKHLPICYIPSFFP